VTAPDRGERTEIIVDLDFAAGPELVLRTGGALPPELDRIAVELRSEHGSEVAVAHRAPDGVHFIVPDLRVHAGRYRLAVDPASQGVGKFLVPVSEDVELPSSGSIEVAVDLRLGGRCAVLLQGPQRNYHADLRLAGPDGRVVWSHAVIAGMNAGDTVITRVGQHFLIAGVGSARAEPWITETLEPGEYFLEVEATDHQHYRAPVLIEAGKQTTVEVELEPLPR
jgi:hypothetical protein